MAARIRFEEQAGFRNGTAIQNARRVEADALRARAYHIEECVECYLDPPRSRTRSFTN